MSIKDSVLPSRILYIGLKWEQFQLMDLSTQYLKCHGMNKRKTLLVNGL